MNGTNLVRRAFDALPDRSRTMVATIIMSLAASGLSVAFLLLTGKLFEATYGNFSRLPPWGFALASLVTIASTSLAVGVLLYKVSPDAAGSGIPQLKAAYWKELGYVPIKPVAVKFIAGVLSLGGGTSLGREGPTVYMGGGLSSWISGYLGYPKPRRRTPSLIGASAGLAAAFNTPLAAITFVLEEIVGDVSGRSIGRVLVSSIVGAFTVYAIIGRQPAFHVPMLEETSWLSFMIAPVVALVGSLLGVVFHKQSLAWRKKIKRQRKIPMWLMPLFGGLSTWAIGVVVFWATGKTGVFGLGYRDLSDVLEGNFLWWAAGLLVIGKLLATIASYSAGGCGGIFSPTLFIGGLAGYFIGSIASFWLHLTSSDLIVLSAVGMAACLGTVVKAPLSAMLIVFEMTHQFAMVPSLLIGMGVSMAVSRMTGSENFYEAILLQDGHELHSISPPSDFAGWAELPVSAIATRGAVAVRDLSPEVIVEMLERYPYAAFPVIRDGVPIGLARRKELAESIRSGKTIAPAPLVTCRSNDTIKIVAERFIETPDGIMAVLDDAGELWGVMTMHDILRAQASLAD